MKTERRHELEKNQLADWLGHKLTWAEQNASTLVAAVVGVVVVIGVVAYWQNSRAERSLTAWNEYFDAIYKPDQVVQAQGLEKVAANESNTVAGQMAEIRLATIAMDEGIEQLNTDREGGEKLLNDAKNRYVTARNAATDPRLKERATLGLARFYETMGLLDEAIKEYRTLADSPQCLYKLDAERKLEYLSMPATIVFAKAYRDRKPAPKPAGTSMFDLDDLNKLPKSEASFPGATPSATGAAATPTTSTTPTASATAAPSATAKPSASPTAAGK